jgi:quinol monooxygenase YgiN
MGDHVSWLLELAVKPGRLDDLRALMAEMVESTKNEPGAMNYEWSISDDDGTVHLYERYADSGAVLTHLAGFGEKFAQRFLADLDPTRVVVYGAPSDEARKALSGLGAVYMAPFGGFAR